MPKDANKTRQTPIEPAAFIASVENATRRADAEVLLHWFADVTGLKPRMWGPSMIGYGRYRYRYDSGHEGEAMLTGFSPRKASLVVYVLPGYRFPRYQAPLGNAWVGRSASVGKTAGAARLQGNDRRAVRPRGPTRSIGTRK